MKYVLLTFALFSLFSTSAYADNIQTKSHLDGLTVGALASFSSNTYAVDDKIGVIPLVLYDNDFFYMEGSELGFYGHKDDKNWFRVGASYDARHFNPENAKIDALKALDERKPSANIVLSYMRITPIGGLEIKAGTDMMDRSGGQTVSFAHRSRFVLADDKLTIYPKFGAIWHSDDYNNYYYGVSIDESTRAGIQEYKPKDGISPFVGVSVKYQFSKQFGIFGNQNVQWLSSTQKDSPLTDDKIDVGTNLGVTYTF